MIKLLIFLLLAPCVSLANTGEISLDKVSEKVEELRSSLELENKKAYLTGGTALSLLDHILYSKPLKMKDIDVALTSPGIDEKRARALSKRLSLKGSSEERGVVPKPWADGWGFFHTYKDIEHLLDVAVFPSEEVINSKNGILNIERVKIFLEEGETLLSAAQKIKRAWEKSNKEPGSVKNFPAVLDAEEGFLSWKRRKPKIVLFQELQALPVVAAMRIIRLHVKIDADLSPELKIILRENLKREDLKFDRLRAARHFSYFFGDERVAEELSFAGEIGLLDRLYPSIASSVSKLSVSELAVFLKINSEKDAAKNVDELRLYRLKNLVQLASVEERVKLQSQLSVFYTSIDLTPHGMSDLSCKGQIS